ncbi:MAG: sodium:solute symporter family protein [Bacteroidetes bacterium]|jgi:SSS family solute:Na+ symporter|nr:sodium:solute symporter family protein [Bacteroidota bacterium]
MNPIDLAVFILYFLIILGIGAYFYFKNEGTDEYYIGGRNMGYSHVGLSVVATDVGGGFSIGLGGLGFVMGISGSWMLFTGFLGAWLAAVFLIPKVKNLSTAEGFFTMPEVFNHFFNARVAFLAGVISAIGYVGFTSSQMLAGARLASSSFDGMSLDMALYIMAAIIVIYTGMGGIKAVIYTDTFQWILLLGGLIFIGIPVSYFAVGGMDAIRETVSPEMLSLSNISWQQFLNWGITILPIWFVGMTLYQRIYATRSEADAKKAWYLAGLLEWPVMAFMGVSLGLFAKVAADQGMFAYLGYEMAADMHEEQGLPMLLRTVLPVGLMGLMMSAYFSAIMSTADSCLMAASGNMTTDIIEKLFKIDTNKISMIRVSQIVTLGLGFLAFLLAAVFDTVLQIMLYSYAFMISALLVPIIGGLYWQKSTSRGAWWSMLIGGGLTLGLTLFSDQELPFEMPVQFSMPLGLDPIIFGITASALTFVTISLAAGKQKNQIT